MNPSLALSRLLQLASPALPVGAYTYSQGLEWAVESGRLKNEADCLTWVGDLLEGPVGRYEAPLLGELIRAWAGDSAAHQDRASQLNDDWLASREGAELRGEAVQMGYSLRRLFHELQAQPQCPEDPALPEALLARLDALPEVAFPSAWSAPVAAWGIAPADALVAYLWSWAENQVMAALKAVPLGQAAGQRVLLALGRRLPTVAARALTLPEEEWCNFAPGFALASLNHETQYSRLFRS